MYSRQGSRQLIKKWFAPFCKMLNPTGPHPLKQMVVQAFVMFGVLWFLHQIVLPGKHLLAKLEKHMDDLNLSQLFLKIEIRC